MTTSARENAITTLDCSSNPPRSEQSHTPSVTRQHRMQRTRGRRSSSSSSSSRTVVQIHTRFSTLAAATTTLAPPSSEGRIQSAFDVAFGVQLHTAGVNSGAGPCRQSSRYRASNETATEGD